MRWMMQNLVAITFFIFVSMNPLLRAQDTSHNDLEKRLQTFQKAAFTIEDLRTLSGTSGFKKYDYNPVLVTGLEGEWDAGALGSMTVVKVENIFHMYYEAWGSLDEVGRPEDYSTLQIGHAVSLDGVHWLKDPANPVIPRGAKGEWDDDSTWDPFVIYENGIFKMWYGGSCATAGEFGYAMSKDGSHFEKKGKVSNRTAMIEDTHVVHDPESGDYLLYYWDRGVATWDKVMAGPPNQPWGLFVARSNNEMDFDFADPKLIKIEGQQWPAKYNQIVRDGDRWVMFYGEAVIRGGVPAAQASQSLKT